MKLVFMHGWSFDSSFWAPLHMALGRPEAVFLEGGYTGKPVSLTLPDTPYLAITHSAGTLACLARHDPLCRGLVAFNGFARFSQSDDYPQGVPLRILARMKSRLTRDPVGVVTQFRQQFDPFIPCETPHTPTLLASLESLIDSDARLAALQRGTGVTCISGRNDPLVSSAMTEASFPHATRHECDGGHLLPLTDPAGCAAFVASKLEQPV